MKASRTINPLHFEDLESHRFEDLVRQVAYGFRTWHSLEDRGKLGSDGGKDILGIEKVIDTEPKMDLEEVEGESDFAESGYEFREWRIQCKRHKRITPRQMTAIVHELVPDPSNPPHGIIIAAPCSISDKAFTAFHTARVNLGITEGHFWNKARLEDFLFSPQYDHLLFAYFGMSLSVIRNSQLSAIRSQIAIKRKLRRAANKAIEDKGINCFLIRDLNDESYFSDGAYKANLGKLNSSLHPVMFQFDAPDSIILGPRGISVIVTSYPGQIKEDGSWDFHEQFSWSTAHHQVKGPLLMFNGSKLEREYQDRYLRYRHYYEEVIPEKERCSIELHRILPYENIRDIDIEGDSMFDCPHLLCEFKGENGPYLSDMTYVNDSGKEKLDLSKRSDFLRMKLQDRYY